MAVKRMLIVDDQRDIRQLLRECIRVLHKDIDVIDVPSGEEAMLVITRQKFDLLVSDVRLAGMSGLELVHKLRKRNPGLKVILVTGLTDGEIRQQVSEAGADAFFFKPVDIAEFQEAVVDCLGLKDSEQAIPPPVSEVEEPAGITLAGQLSKLRSELKADCLLLITLTGNVLERSGTIPADLDEGTLVASSVAMQKARVALAPTIGEDRSQDYLISHRRNYQLLLVPAGDMRLLLMLTRAGMPDQAWEAIAAAMSEAAAVLSVEPVGDTPSDVLPKEEAPAVAADEEPAIDEVDISQLDVAIQSAGETSANRQELDDFWDTAAEHVVGDGSSESGSISYEQAQRLGIAPADESG